jgi:type 1 glutamine amidotransferase
MKSTRHTLYTICLAMVVILASSISSCTQPMQQWVRYEGKEGPGKGKHIVFISGDEEYRSEESLPMMAKILSQLHGFTCTVLFATNPETGLIDPNAQTNIPGMEHLQKADLLFICLRFRELPDNQMKYFDEYLQSGKPIVALRTSTHAFLYSRNKESVYAKYSYNSKVKNWESGFGKAVLGETWVSHHGDHGSEGTRGLINGVSASHPVLKGVKDIWGPTDVYTVKDLGANVNVLLYGQSSLGMTADAPLSYEKSIMPVAWTKSYQTEIGKTAKIFTTTMGASMDLKSEDLRRMLINASYWALNMEAQIPDKSNAETIGAYEPIMFGFDKYKKGMKPSDFNLK